ncbi:hypothetical protein WJX79_002829 [Trebouxia sp. C0005]
MFTGMSMSPEDRRILAQRFGMEHDEADWLLNEADTSGSSSEGSVSSENNLRPSSVGRFRVNSGRHSKLRAWAQASPSEALVLSVSVVLGVGKGRDCFQALASPGRYISLGTVSACFQTRRMVNFGMFHLLDRTKTVGFDTAMTCLLQQPWVVFSCQIQTASDKQWPALPAGPDRSIADAISERNTQATPTPPTGPLPINKSPMQLSTQSRIYPDSSQHVARKDVCHVRADASSQKSGRRGHESPQAVLDLILDDLESDALSSPDDIVYQFSRDSPGMPHGSANSSRGRR